MPASLNIGLVAFGRALRIASGSPADLFKPEGLKRVMSGVRDLLREDPDSRLQGLAGKIDPQNPDPSARALLNYKGYLFEDQAARERLVAVLRPEKGLISPDLFRGTVSWFQSQRQGPIGAYLLSSLPEGAATTQDPQNLQALLEDLKELHSLQLIAGVALLYEGQGRLEEAERLYQWYLVTEEQTGRNDLELLSWGIDRLATVWRAQDRKQLASGLERLRSENLELDVVVDRLFDAAIIPVSDETPSRFHARLQDELTTIDPGEAGFSDKLSAFLDKIPLGPEAWPGVEPRFLRQLGEWVAGMREFLSGLPGLESGNAPAIFSVLRDGFPVGAFPAAPARMGAAAEPTPPDEGDQEVDVGMEFEELPLEGERQEAPRGAVSAQVYTLDLTDPPAFARRLGLKGEGATPSKEVVFLDKLLRERPIAMLREFNIGDSLVILLKENSLPNLLARKEVVAEALRGQLDLLEGKTVYIQSNTIGLRFKLTVSRKQATDLPFLAETTVPNPDFIPDAAAAPPRGKTIPPKGGRGK